jgi:large subunit ribosomal protein L29
MKASALRSKSASELQEELMALRREQFALRLQRATGQMPKPDQFGKVRKNIARLLTVQNQVRRAGVGAGFAAAAAASARAATEVPAQDSSAARPAGRARSSRRKAEKS